LSIKPENLEKSRRKLSYILGKSGEDIAIKYLKKKRYKIVEKGFRLFRGEIDIIAYDGRTLVFVEVKTRKSTNFGLPEEYVTYSKQKQIRKIANGYLFKNNLQYVECRFDVVSVIVEEKNKHEIHHIKNAF